MCIPRECDLQARASLPCAVRGRRDNFRITAARGGWPRAAFILPAFLAAFFSPQIPFLPIRFSFAMLARSTYAAKKK
jgi:hypothetical protein